MRPVTDLERRVAPFRVVSDYQPSGDQPAAIAEITKRINAGVQDVVLLGATGTGKTATVAWVAEQVQRPIKHPRSEGNITESLVGTNRS